MSARNSREAKARRRAERVQVAPEVATRIGVCRGCGAYPREMHAASRLCAPCLAIDTEASSAEVWAAEVADMARHKILV